MDIEGEGIKDKCVKPKKEENAYVYGPIQTSGYMENKCKDIVGRFHSRCCQSVLS